MSHKKIEKIKEHAEVCTLMLIFMLLCGVLHEVSQSVEFIARQTKDATPQEVEDWYNTELKWWGDRHLISLQLQQSFRYLH